VSAPNRLESASRGSLIPIAKIIIGASASGGAKTGRELQRAKTFLKRVIKS
jgi:hypothetical protein